MATAPDIYSTPPADSGEAISTFKFPPGFNLTFINVYGIDEDAPEPQKIAGLTSGFQSHLGTSWRNFTYIPSKVLKTDAPQDIIADFARNLLEFIRTRIKSDSYLAFFAVDIGAAVVKEALILSASDVKYRDNQLLNRTCLLACFGSLHRAKNTSESVSILSNLLDRSCNGKYEFHQSPALLVDLADYHAALAEKFDNADKPYQIITCFQECGPDSSHTEIVAKSCAQTLFVDEITLGLDRSHQQLHKVLGHHEEDFWRIQVVDACTRKIGVYQDLLRILSPELPRTLPPSVQTYEHLAECILNRANRKQWSKPSMRLGILQILLPYFPVRPDKLGHALALVLHDWLPTNILLKPITLYLDDANLDNKVSGPRGTFRAYASLCANLLRQRPSLAMRIWDVILSDLTYTRGQKLFTELSRQLQALLTKLLCCQNTGRVYVVINVSSVSSAVQDTIDTLSRILSSTDSEMILIILMKPSIQGDLSIQLNEADTIKHPFITHKCNVTNIPTAQHSLDSDIKKWLVSPLTLGRSFLTEETQSEAFQVLKGAQSWAEVDQFLIYLQQVSERANSPIHYLTTSHKSTRTVLDAIHSHGIWLLVALLWIYNAKRPLTLDELDQAVSFDMLERWMKSAPELDAADPDQMANSNENHQTVLEYRNITRDIIRLLPGTILVDGGRVFPIAPHVEQCLDNSKTLNVVDASSPSAYLARSCLRQVQCEISKSSGPRAIDDDENNFAWLGKMAQYAFESWRQHYLDCFPLQSLSQPPEESTFTGKAGVSLQHLATEFLNSQEDVRKWLQLIRAPAGVHDVKAHGDIFVSPKSLQSTLKISIERATRLSATMATRIDTWNSYYDSLLLEAVDDDDYSLYELIRNSFEEGGQSFRGETIAQVLLTSFAQRQGFEGTLREICLSLDPSMTLYHIASQNPNILDLILASPGKKDHATYMLRMASRLGDLPIFSKVIADIKDRTDDGSASSEGEPGLYSEILLVAVASGQVDILRELLGVISPAKLYTKSGMTALMLASLLGLTSVLELLLGRDHNGINSKRMATEDSALHLASRGGFCKTLALLLAPKFGADPFSQNSRDELPLHVALAHGHLEVARLLMESMSDSARRSTTHAKSEETPLIQQPKPSPDSGTHTDTSDSESDYSSDPDTEHPVTEKGSRPNVPVEDVSCPLDIKCKGGQTAFVLAARNGFVDICKVMVEKGADATLVDSMGMSALHHAAELGSLDLVQFLLDHGLDCNLRELLYNYTPLYFAAKLGHLAVVAALLEHNNNLIAPLDGENHLAPLQVAVTQGHRRVVEVLVKRCTKTEEALSGLSMALLPAASQRDALIIECLLDNGADVNFVDSYENTALHFAAYNDRVQVVKLLVLKKANLDCPDNGGFTPLMDATRRGSLSSLNVLITAGADMEALNNFGLSPLDLAIKYDQVESGRLLVNKLTQRNSVWNKLSNETLRSLLKFAVDHLSTDLVLSILSDVVGKDSNSKKFATFSAKEFICSILWDRWLAVLEVFWDQWDASTLQLGKHGTALHYAAMRHQASIVRTILSSNKYHIDIDSRASKLGTPLQAAIFTLPKLYYTKPFCQTIELLLKFGADSKIAGETISRALQAAVYHRCVELVKSLLEKLQEGDVLRTGGEYGTVLQAFFSGPSNSNDEAVDEVLQLILKHAPNESFTRPGGHGDLTALHRAAQFASLRLVKLVSQQSGVEEGIESPDRMGRLPVHLAAWFMEKREDCGAWDVIKALDPTLKTLWKRDKLKRSVLHVAAARGDIKLLENILEVAKNINSGSDNRTIRVLMNKKDVDGWTALHWACRLPGNDKVVKWLIDNEADATKRTSDNWLPRHVAIYHGCKFLDILKTERGGRLKSNDLSADLDTRELPTEAANDLGYFCDSCFCNTYEESWHCDTCTEECAQIEFDLCFKCYKSKDIVHPKDHVFVPLADGWYGKFYKERKLELDVEE